MACPPCTFSKPVDLDPMRPFESAQMMSCSEAGILVTVLLSIWKKQFFSISLKFVLGSKLTTKCKQIVVRSIYEVSRYQNVDLAVNTKTGQSVT